MKSSCSFLAIVVLLQYSNIAVAASGVAGNETDHLALLQFKAKITADPLGVLTSWNATTHFCHWHGVTCSRRRRRVTVVDLGHSNLAGSISPHIGNLSFLKNLILQNNSFTHQIPPEIGRLRRLQLLWLHNNSIEGTIPANISSCSALVHLVVTKNNLVGQIPMELGSLSNLKILSFGFNYVTRSIPSSLGNLSSLEVLFATQNSFVGTVPDHLSQLRNLKTLALARNRLSGLIHPSIFNLSSLQKIDMGQNQIQGSLPTNLGNALPNLNFFSVGSNQFTGSIPVSVSNASQLGLFQVSENILSGNVPSFEKLYMLQFLNLRTNHLEDLSFICSLTNATTLLSLVLTENNFGGTLSECVGNLSTTIAELLLDGNKISGTIPVGIGNLVNLETLYMQNNQLSGEVPFSFGSLQNLKYLALYVNNLSGKIPSSLGNMKLLLLLYLYSNNFQGSIPSSLGQCQYLLLLILFNNSLTGSIPPQVIGLSSLSIALDLSQNRLSGALPVEIGNLKNLGYLDVSGNLLRGEIPMSLGNCVRLETLKLGSNFFQGDIQTSLSSLRGVKELNLSHNNLSGKIPQFLEDFESLQSLDLSENKFEGAVPMEGVFKNASATFLAGNKDLCGGILEFQLPKCISEGSRRNGLSLNLIKVIASVSGVLVVLSILSVLFLCCFRRKRAVSDSSPSKEFFLRVSYQALLKATDEFSEGNMIGKGSVGSVYKGILDHSHTIVAVKVFNLLHPTAAKSFTAECEALRNIRHRNLVSLLTTCSGIDRRGNDFKALVYEFMVNGSLEEWLHPVPTTTNTGEAPRKLNLVQRLNIIIDVASAIEYLHHCHHQSPIVHCDLKPSNVLLDGELIGHVGDFGLARFLQEVIDEETSSIAIKGSIGYTAPEYGMGSELSTNGDAYSFGILMLEVFTGMRPTDEIFQDDMNLHNSVKEALPEGAAEILDPVLLPEIEVATRTTILNCLVSIFGIALACSVDLPSERLSFEEVVTQLSAVRSKLVANY